MEIKVGDIYRMETGEGLRIHELNSDGTFSAQLRSMTTGEWTDYYMQGETAKLPSFLEANGAVKEHLQ